MYLNAVSDAFGNWYRLRPTGEGLRQRSRRAEALQPRCVPWNSATRDHWQRRTRTHISTRYVERQNLNMRMNMRRFTRLTNAFSKKIDNHIHMVALFHMHYNFARAHQTLRVPPAMEAGISSHVWSIQHIVALTAPAQFLAA